MLTLQGSLAAASHPQGRFARSRAGTDARSTRTKCGAMRGEPRFSSLSKSHAARQCRGKIICEIAVGHNLFHAGGVPGGKPARINSYIDANSFRAMLRPAIVEMFGISALLCLTILKHLLPIGSFRSAGGSICSVVPEHRSRIRDCMRSGADVRCGTRIANPLGRAFFAETDCSSLKSIRSAHRISRGSVETDDRVTSGL
jgi:hypothetical protein